VLFNGEESFGKGKDKIETGFQDDYSEILPVFYYEKKSALSSASSDMDRTIKKCLKLISLHSITVKPKVKNSKNLSARQRTFLNKKEYNLYADDAYLLKGKAHFYKHEFELAGESFKLIINDFKNQPVVFETRVWLARLYVQTGDYLNAHELLASLLLDSEFPDKLLRELYPTLADLYLHQNEPVQAIEYLNKALQVEKAKQLRIRYTYILAQLYEKTGNLKSASELFTRVIQMNPDYDMTFNAHIRRALAYEQGFGQVNDIAEELRKMLRDDKNIDYQDQIYFALGNLASKEGDNPRAVDNYKKSIQANTGNEMQKVRSYLALANLYYSIPDYPNAQVYYDSTVTFTNAEAPGYEALYAKSRSLTRLIESLNTLTLADSVISLSRLPRQELDRCIEEMIAAEREREELARKKQIDEQRNQQYALDLSMESKIRAQNSKDASRWYFYNDVAKSQGYKEFVIRWGQRRLEDHWQRANKALASFSGTYAQEELPEFEETEDPQKKYSKLSREYYLSGIPFTDSAVTSLLNQAENALYQMAIIYRNDLKDTDKATESFKTLIARFPNSPDILPAYYNLYGIATDQHNLALIEHYKALIIRQFPESMYARVLTNPEYFKELLAQEKAVQDYYNQTYLDYKAGKWNETILRTTFAINNYNGSSLISKFKYLQVLAQGKTSDRKVFRDQLLALSEEYPHTDIAEDAGNIIRYMDSEHPEWKEAEETTISRKLYLPPSEGVHIFAFVLEKKIDANQLIFNMINFNLDLFDPLNLIVQIEDLNLTQNLILVRTFRNREDALAYKKAIDSSEAIFKDMPALALTSFVITPANLNILKEDKILDRYIKFFLETYR
jgi:tetratricopeptide (TPR) repeat protein